jgi:hypothetical protein
VCVVSCVVCRVLCARGRACRVAWRGVVWRVCRVFRVPIFVLVSVVVRHVPQVVCAANCVPRATCHELCVHVSKRSTPAESVLVGRFVL